MSVVYFSYPQYRPLLKRFHPHTPQIYVRLGREAPLNSEKLIFFGHPDHPFEIVNTVNLSNKVNPEPVPGVFQEPANTARDAKKHSS